MKLTTRCGSARWTGSMRRCWPRPQAKVLRTNRIRVDTTVVAANVSSPTDSGLLARAVRRIAAVGQRMHAAGGETRTRLRNRSRAAGKRAHEIAAKLRPLGGRPVKAVLERGLATDSVIISAMRKAPRRARLAQQPQRRYPENRASEFGPVDLAVPRDRESSFDSRLVPKGWRRLADGLDEMIISLYAGG